MTADVPAPQSSATGITAQAVFRREDIGVVIAASGCAPAGEAGAAPPVGVVLMRPQTQPAHRRLLIRHRKCSPTRGSRVSARSPSTANRRVPSAVKCMRQWLTIYLFAAQVVPAAVEGFICQRCASHWTQCASRSYRPALLQRSTQALGSIRSTSLTPMSLSSGARINWSRRGQQLLLTANRPAAQQTRPAIDGPALRTGADLPDLIADDKIRSGRHGGRRQRQRGQGKLLPATRCSASDRAVAWGWATSTVSHTARAPAGRVRLSSSVISSLPSGGSARVWLP